MRTPLHTLRAQLAKASEYAREHDVAAVLVRLTTVVGFLTVLALVALGLWVVTVVPHRYVQHILEGVPGVGAAQRLELEDTYRKTITQIVLGVFGLFLLYFTWRRSVAGDKTVRIAEQGHITERFTKAIEQLGQTNSTPGGTTPNIEVRLGAIYALERIALDSPRDYWNVMDVLTAYVRYNAPVLPRIPYAEGEKPRTEMQAILTVLSRRSTDFRRDRNDHLIDLSNCRLCGLSISNGSLPNANFLESNLQNASFSGANLQGANFSSANLQGSDLQNVDLKGGYLLKANLQGARLLGANLQEAYLSEANLQQSVLRAANLEGAFLRNANLQDADLLSANLRDAMRITTTQIKSAKNWPSAYYSLGRRAELGLLPESTKDKNPAA